MTKVEIGSVVLVAVAVVGMIITAPGAMATEAPSMVVSACGTVASGRPRVWEHMPAAFTDENPAVYSLSQWTSDGNTLLRVVAIVDYRKGGIHGDLANPTGPALDQTLVYKAGSGDLADAVKYNESLLDSQRVTGC